jgi:hypothetical protein
MSSSIGSARFRRQPTEALRRRIERAVEFARQVLERD